MAKTRSRTQRKPNSTAKISKKKEVKFGTDAIRESMEDGFSAIQPLEMLDEEFLVEDDPALKDILQTLLSPKSSLEAIRKQEEVQHDFINFLRANDQCNSAILQGKAPTPPILRSGSVVRNLDTSFIKSDQGNGKLLKKPSFGEGRARCSTYLRSPSPETPIVDYISLLLGGCLSAFLVDDRRSPRKSKSTMFEVRRLVPVLVIGRSRLKLVPGLWCLKSLCFQSVVAIEPQ
uniref:Uncharacterized protein n=1 Tax=Cannabis sativa TaxID=3483 RepID=A0A803PJS9_CANSA